MRAERTAASGLSEEGAVERPLKMRAYDSKSKAGSKCRLARTHARTCMHTHTHASTNSLSFSLSLSHRKLVNCKSSTETKLLLLVAYDCVRV